MTNTIYYNLNIVEGTDIVNPLTVDNPNYQKIDETMHDNAVAGVTLATELTNATIHALTRENSDCSVIRFIATSKWKAGDSVTVDGVPVLALLPSGETLPDGAYVINANVLCVLTGTNLTVYVGKSATDASEIAFNNTTVGAELVKLNGEIVNLNGQIENINGDIVNLNGQIENINSRLNLQYSTDEIDTGKKWIDGKTIYRKCYTGGSFNANTVKVLDSTINSNNIDTVINMSGSYKKANDGMFRPIYTATESTTGDNAGMSISIGGENLYLYGYNVSTSKYTVIIEYTKM